MKRYERPDRRGRPWSCEEDQLLVKALAVGFDRERIARGHRRSTGAISSRISRHMFCTRGMNYGIAYVSTKEKAQVVCELLTKWEIK